MSELPGMRLFASAAALLAVVTVLSSCQDEPAQTDGEEIVDVNDGIGPVLELPDGSTLDVEIRAAFPGAGFDACEVELLADAFAFEPDERHDGRLVILAVGHEDDLDALAECAGLIDPDDQ